ncbi:MAG: hypothetical protein KGI98_08435, partial [Euryarchaeota archaeon]|nr:hypothetical protein [Euryarchaeota archaeon]
NYDVLSREEEFGEIDLRSQIESILVDTNVLAALLCETDSLHLVALAACQRAVEMGISLRYLESTEHELNSLIQASLFEMRGLSIKKGRALVRSQFTRDFLAGSQTWEDYSTALQKWRLFVSGLCGLTRLQEPPDPDEDVVKLGSDLLPVLNKVREDERRKGKDYLESPRDDLQIAHDAHALGVVSSLRLQHQASSGFIGPLFLSYDNIVSAVGEAIRRSKSLKHSLVIQPRSLLNYLLVYTRAGIIPEKRQEVARAIITLTARVRHPRVTLSDYARLTRSKVGLPPSEAQLLYDAFYHSPLREELEAALRENRAEDADRTAGKILSDREYISRFSKERATAAKLLSVAGKYEEAERKHEEEMVAVRVAMESLKAELQAEKTNRRALEAALLRPPAVITVVANLSQNATANASAVNSTGTEVEAIANLIRSSLPTGFRAAGLPEPPAKFDDPAGNRTWLDKLRGAIEASQVVAPAVKAALPIISALLIRLSGLPG